jgi:hypothetical protein
MSTIELKYDWQDPGGVNIPEWRATWASLAIEVAGKSVTHVTSRHERAVREHLHVALYPLAEWVARCWFSLFYEAGSPQRLGKQFLLRHDLCGTGDGFAWPALRLYPVGPFIQLFWKPYVHAPSGIEFLSSGEELIDAAAAERAVFDLISSVVARLDEEGVADTPLQQDWASILALEPQERAFCETVARFGLDPFDVDPATAGKLVSWHERLGASVAEDIFALADPAKFEPTVAWFEKSSEALEAGGQQLTGLARLREIAAGLPELGTGEIRPWDFGYAAAREFRTVLARPAEEAIDALQVFGVESEGLTIEGPPLNGLEAIMIRQGDAARIGLLRSRPKSQRGLRNRFDVCRAGLRTVLPASGAISVLSETYSAPQKDAFAAELLAPAEGIRKVISDAEIVTEGDIEDVSDHFGVTPAVIYHQIANHALARVVDAGGRVMD